MESIILILLSVMLVAMVLTAIRLGLGPSLADRVVALEVLASIGVATCVLFAMGYHQQVYLDVAVVLALVSFVGTVAFARFLEKKARS